MIAVYYSLPKNQGITLRKLVRSTTLDIVDGMAQLMDALFMTPTQSSENNDLISYNSVWTACQQVPQIPRDNKAAALSMLTKNVDFVKDAHEEMEQAVEECDPYCGLLNDTEDNSDNHGDEEDDGLGYPNNRDLYWSEEDQELIIPCLALVRASKACLKKIRISVAENGKKDQVAQLDDIVDISDEISPSVDDLALSIYPPMCHLTVRINSAKLVSVLKKALEITKASHVTPQPEDSWIPLLINAVDHCMNRIKELTQNELELSNGLILIRTVLRTETLGFTSLEKITSKPLFPFAEKMKPSFILEESSQARVPIPNPVDIDLYPCCHPEDEVSALPKLNLHF
ncbi:cyclin-D1-binding protein 1 isoform X1 [Herpailurus yagouaroundi]|uniref:cyclin-D1-binding protein 1 isoform X1 n=1 Tax=Herpailurus yagouaroundi TaxID=1608482 RepID=UPI001AD6F08C|nr:cyclin-D1-binding protein 1 isoform X1 [Puma yagouaroundi]